MSDCAYRANLPLLTYVQYSTGTVGRMYFGLLIPVGKKPTQDRQTDSQTARQTNKQTNRQTDRQTTILGGSSMNPFGALAWNHLVTCQLSHTWSS